MSTYNQLVENASVKHFDRVQKLCRPLLESFGINHFYYSTITNEGLFYELGSNIEWLQRYAQLELFKINPFMVSPDKQSSGVYPHKAIKSYAFSKILKAAADCHVYPFLLVIQRTPEGVCRYGFNLDSKFRNFDLVLINELPLLNKFVDYFVTETKPIFETLVDDPVNLVHEMGSKFYENPNLPEMQISFDARLKYLKELKLVSDEVLDIKLTNREKACLSLRHKKQSAKEIAETLELSVRTVENYLNTAKMKLTCDGKSSFFDRMEQLNLLGII